MTFETKHARFPINYGYISNAVLYYTQQQYKYLELPWVASPEAIAITFPDIPAYRTPDHGVFVGSAEQSFLQLHLEGHQFGTYPYVAVTPCMRDEEPDATHSSSFIKVELFSTNVDYKRLLNDARRFFMARHSIEALEEKVSETQIDLVYRGIELGSYGTHTLNGFTWHYGTGLAEPRMSYVESLKKKGRM